MHLCVVVLDHLRPVSSELPTPALSSEPDQNCSVVSVLLVMMMMMKMSATQIAKDINSMLDFGQIGYFWLRWKNLCYSV